MKYFKHTLIFLLLSGSGTKIQAQECTKIAKEIMVKDTIPEMTISSQKNKKKDKRMKNFYFEQGSL